MIKVTLANGQTRTFDDAIGYKVSDGMLRVLREFEGDTPEGFLKRGEKTIATFAPGWISAETVEDSIIDSLIDCIDFAIIHLTVTSEELLGDLSESDKQNKILTMKSAGETLHLVARDAGLRPDDDCEIMSFDDAIDVIRRTAQEQRKHFTQ